MTRNPYDPLLQVQKDSYRCGKCMLCKYIDHEEITDTDFMGICPSGLRYKYEAYYASGRQEIARGLLEGSLEYSDSLKHVLFTCTECGGCQVICSDQGNKNPLKTIVALRERAFRDELAPLPEHETLIKSMENYDNPWQQPRARRDVWMKKMGLPDARKQKVEVLYYVGCTAAYDPKLQGIARATAEILLKAGVPFGVLGKDELCCGSTLLRMGDYDAYRKRALMNMESLESVSSERIVTSCSGCNSILREEYEEFGGLSSTVTHSLELIDELIRSGDIKLKKPVKKKVTYHDPCHLGRMAEPFLGQWNGSKLERPMSMKRSGRNGCYDAPRDLLRAVPGLELVEMERIREYSLCCGAGGGVYEAFPDFASWAAAERLEEAAATGADALATACPWCERVFKETAREAGLGLEIYDVADIVIKSTGG